MFPGGGKPNSLQDDDRVQTASKPGFRENKMKSATMDESLGTAAWFRKSQKRDGFLRSSGRPLHNPSSSLLGQTAENHDNGRERHASSRGGEGEAHEVLAVGRVRPGGLISSIVVKPGTVLGIN